MIYFHNDYNQMCHPRVMERLQSLQASSMMGYGMDTCCHRAAAMIRTACGSQDVAVHFLVGGTQANLTVISAALRPHEAVIGAHTAHINVHETGAIEATGHKVIGLPSDDGKITSEQVEQLLLAHLSDSDREHTARPRMVYISQSTEMGTIYSKDELTALSHVCRKFGLYLFVDGARLGYALAAQGADLTLQDMAELCDVFYIGGTKQGAMMGEAVVISNSRLADEFRYLIKQHGGMLAKGWLLGAQFEALLEDGLYFLLAARADQLADRIRHTLLASGIPQDVPGVTNQVFPVLSLGQMAQVESQFTFSKIRQIDETHWCVRFCTSWASTEKDVDALCEKLREIAKNSEY